MKFLSNKTKTNLLWQTTKTKAKAKKAKPVTKGANKVMTGKPAQAVRARKALPAVLPRTIMPASNKMYKLNSPMHHCVGLLLYGTIKNPLKLNGVLKNN
jgi:hypothetical protein